MVQFNADKISPFLQAVKEGNKEAVEKGLAGVTALMMAVMSGHAEMAQLLLSKGADASGAEPLSKRTPLMFAAQGSVPKLVEILLSAKADASKVDKEGQTALMWAAVAGRTDTAKILAAAGGKDTKNKDGLTAADIA